MSSSIARRVKVAALITAAVAALTVLTLAGMLAGVVVADLVTP